MIFFQDVKEHDNSSKYPMRDTRETRVDEQVLEIHF
jgi:hypothetical protein